MHSRRCNSPVLLRRRHGPEGPVSPVATGDRDPTGDRNLPVISTRSPLSPVSPVARTREDFQSTTRFGGSGRVQHARVNFSETCGGGGDTGDRSTVRAAEALHLRPTAPLLPDVGGATMAKSAAAQLRALASRVRRVGLNGRLDPEAAFIERDELAHALRRLADSLERGASQPPAPASTSRAVIPRRFAAVLAARASEITSLRTLLAQAVRPVRHRRRSASEAQLMLPLSEAVHER
jgi:hypothetical protein